jgi:hypothetical protein
MLKSLVTPARIYMDQVEKIEDQKLRSALVQL